MMKLGLSFDSILHLRSDPVNTVIVLRILLLLLSMLVGHQLEKVLVRTRVDYFVRSAATFSTQLILVPALLNGPVLGLTSASPAHLQGFVRIPPELGPCHKGLEITERVLVEVLYGGM